MLVLRVRSKDSRKIAAQLAEDPAVARFELRDDGNELTVRGADSAMLALAIARAARNAEAIVTAIEPTLPALDETRAASAALWRAAFEAAYRAGQAHARAQAEAWRAASQPPAAPTPPPPPSGGAE
jgi:hypothetical protein